MASKSSTKDKEMAARLKKLGVHRSSGICPICNRPLPLSSMMNHISTHS